MNETNPIDVKFDENPDGTVTFATDVVATIAGLAATEVDGVASMTSPITGLADILSRKSSRNLTKGVQINLEENKVSVDITITVEYGTPVPEVARGIQENVKKAIETMAGLSVRKVDVHVQGVSFERENRQTAELDEQHKALLKNIANEQTVQEQEAEEAPAEDVEYAGEPESEPIENNESETSEEEV